ncbi:MAG: FAD-dependent oxidoreductase [Desulfobacterales bacterium]|nr:FAD-dependent oxidoreductase [Desulfobacterales bacterium]
MNETSPEILILGGGVAGMSAALALKHQDVLVHLVEKQEYLGGNTAAWACMATHTCQNCGACLGHEMADQIRQAENITTHLNTRVTAVKRTETGMEATLSSGKTLTPAKAILATGFSPFDPGNIPSYHTKTLDKVITTAKLNTLIREGKLTDFLGAAGPAPKIAFLQCVGSRDRKGNRDYCSQVCCKISMRHAGKLLRLMPGADISLFYMDLQVIGKEARTAADRLSREISLIQGVPAEILENPETGGMTMVTEDPATQSRKSMEFDLIVLSVGMSPAEESKTTSDIFGAKPNTWGFFNTDEADPDPDLIVAGCAGGPKDIVSSSQDGRIAAARALGELDLARTPAAIAVIGDGPAAVTIASAVADQGYPACLFGSGKDIPASVKDMGSAGILAVDGTIGRFSIFHEAGGTKTTLDCGAIIAAPQPLQNSNTDAFKGAMGLADFSAMPPGESPDTTLILLDYFGPEFKAPARQALTAALAAKEAGKQVDILMNKMLVHGPEGQRLYDRARKAGIRFLRYETASDVTITPGDKGFGIRLKEATLPGHELLLETNTLVVPDTIAASPLFSELARLLNLGLDMEGFLQPANVRHRLVQSQRKGIFFAGPGHDDIDGTDLAMEIRAILAALATQADNTGACGPVTVNEKKCAKCLTCYRVCPHGAIILNEKSRPQIVEAACFACQACVSNCPAFAIESKGFANEDLAVRAQKGRTLVLACERSAALAAASLPDTADMVRIPCACRISPDMILKALIKGSDRVIISGCHEGNCRSGDGSVIAGQSVDTVKNLPGIPADRVIWKPVAANEPETFAGLVSPQPQG